MKHFIEVASGYTANDAKRTWLNLDDVTYVTLEPDSNNRYGIALRGSHVHVSREDADRILKALKQL